MVILNATSFLERHKSDNIVTSNITLLPVINHRKMLFFLFIYSRFFFHSFILKINNCIFSTYSCDLLQFYINFIDSMVKFLKRNDTLTPPTHLLIFYTSL
jgi:hypothetical protein